MVTQNKISQAVRWFACLFILSVSQVMAQNEVVIRGKIISQLEKEALISVTVTEVDKNNRVVGGTVTNIEGEFVLKIKNTANKIVFSYIGYKKQQRSIGNQTNFDVTLAEDNLLTEVVVTARQTTNTGGLNIPTREISTAMQKISTREFEGIQVTSIEDALQGRIGGLDIVSNSGAPGSGMSMRIRGTTSINSGSQPLIVVNGIPYETNVSADFDFATAREEQYADLLNVNPDDISEIVVLKDAASTAIWGSKGANGVLQITTKKGVKGKPKVQYSFRITRAYMPEPTPLLNGDDYTMMMKEAYLNPGLNTSAANIPEYSYIQNGSAFFWNYNNNTDWVSEVKQVAWKKDHNISLDGGGERGDYRISFGYLDETGIVKGQGLKRFSNRTDLRYKLSDRISFSPEIAYTYTENDKNYNDKILDIAMRKMPNVPVYARDKDGNYTDVYFNIDRATSKLHESQRDMVNPVASVNLATYKERIYRVIPTFRLQYDILDPAVQVLRFKSQVSMDLTSKQNDRNNPKEVNGAIYTDDGINTSFLGDEQSSNIALDNNLQWVPKMPQDHSLMLYGSMQTGMGSYMSQSLSSKWGSSSALGSVAGGVITETKSYSSESRSFGALVSSHYTFKERYILDLVLRRDVSSRFGKNSRVGYFPGVSAKWIITDEPFMKNVKFLNMFAIRPSWGISGNTPSAEYLHFSKYSSYENTYLGITSVYPNGLQIPDLRWEKTMQANLGVDLELFDGKLVADLNLYYKETKDLLFKDLSISSSSGFGSIPYQNTGTMENTGWEFNMRAPKVLQIGAFSADLSFNFSNYRNTITELSDRIKTEQGKMYENGQYLRKVQIGNPLGSFYGYKFKGVYQYSDYIPGKQENAPVARDASGAVIYDKNGLPKPMIFTYGAGKTQKYQFVGGDAIYEDVNKDGSIDELDVVYLGNANPKLNGGFNLVMRYKSFSVNGFFHFRYGNKIVNDTRMRLENMYGNDNQSIAVNWRWRKEGDVTEMPRALYDKGYNWLGSDRFVEDGSFLRFKYLTFNYNVPKKVLKKYKLTDLKFYCTINNIATWTNYSGVEPEVGYAASKDDPFRIGYDTSKTPRSKDATFGVTIGF